MKIRTGSVAVIGVLGVAIVVLVFGRLERTNIPLPQTAGETQPQTSPASSSGTTAAENKISTAATSANFSKATPGALAVSSTAPPPLVSFAPEFTNLPPETVLENMRTVFHSYASMFSGNPVGTNPEITAALDGNNRKQAHFLSEDDGQRINSRGELIDSWGTPYFFHQLSGTEMEIHSAGPDKVMWTTDDLVIK